MAFKLTKRNGTFLANVNEYICDAEADLTDIPSEGAAAAPFGSKAFCIAEGTTLYLDSTGTWVDPTAEPDTTPDAPEETPDAPEETPVDTPDTPDAPGAEG